MLEVTQPGQAQSAKAREEARRRSQRGARRVVNTSIEQNREVFKEVVANELFRVKTSYVRAEHTEQKNLPVSLGLCRYWLVFSPDAFNDTSYFSVLAVFPDAVCRCDFLHHGPTMIVNGQGLYPLAEVRARQYRS
jgi:hypothetical protein